MEFRRTLTTNEPILIDGSFGEGGGQIVRSSAALAIITQRELTLTNVRHRRKPTGLKRQHMTALRAAAEIGGGQLTGAIPGSTTFTFKPGKVQPGPYHFAVGTAGSATLVLQTVLPALLLADGPSTVTVEGGTHNPWAPPFEFLQNVYAPLINRMGARLSLQLEWHGFYPTGGGRIVAEITPTPLLRGFDLLERGKIERQRVTAVLAGLQEHIGQREIKTAFRHLDWKERRRHPLVDWQIDSVEASSPGNVLFIEVASEHVTELVTAFGKQGIRAEAVAKTAAGEMQTYLAANVPVGEHLADQLLLPLGLSAWQASDVAAEEAGSHRFGGSFRTLKASDHTTTHIDILQRFLGIDVVVEPTVTETADGKSLETAVIHVRPPRPAV